MCNRRSEYVVSTKRVFELPNDKLIELFISEWVRHDLGFKKDERMFEMAYDELVKRGIDLTEARFRANDLIDKYLNRNGILNNENDY